jgi:D-alanine-D-alanine ligase-like ATP-grasp enzyme
MKRVGVLRGGKKDYERSLKRGGDVILFIYDHLPKYVPLDILVDTDGVWHLAGLPIEPAGLMHKVDLVWNVAEPELSKVLENFAIPHITVSPFANVFTNSRDALNNYLKTAGMKMPRRVERPRDAREVFEKFGAPWIVKNDVGMGVVTTFPELVYAIENAPETTVEEFITGSAGAAHTVSGFRGSDVYVFLHGNFSRAEKEQIAAHAKKLHQHIGAKHYLKSDYVVHPKRGVFLTGIDFHPDLRKGSHFRTSTEPLGAKASHVIEHILENATAS